MNIYTYIYIHAYKNIYIYIYIYIYKKMVVLGPKKESGYILRRSTKKFLFFKLIYFVLIYVIYMHVSSSLLSSCFVLIFLIEESIAEYQ